MSERLDSVEYVVANEDNQFILKLKSRDPEALEASVRLHTSHLYKACLGLGFSDQDAEDITQSVWITFFDVIHQFEARSSVRTFLFGILYNKASEFRKKNNKAEPVDNIEVIIDSHFEERGHWIVSHSPVSPDRFMQSGQTLSIISKCLDRLPLNQKMAFVLKEIDEEVTEEICNILSITVTNLGVLLFRAKNQLRECIDSKSR